MQERFEAAQQGQAQGEPEWVKQRRAEAEKRQAEMQERFEAAQQGQAQGEPEWVKQRRAEAEKYNAEMQRRFAEANKQQMAYAARGYGMPYGTPFVPHRNPFYGAPYGYAPRPQFGPAN